MYFKRVEEPRAIIMARDEPYTAAAKTALKTGSAAAGSKTTPGASPAVKAPATVGKKLEKGKKATENREKPTNQHGTKPAKTSQKKDYTTLAAFMDHIWHLTKLDIVDMVNDQDNWKTMTQERLRPVVVLTIEEIKKKTEGLNIDQEVLDRSLDTLFNELGDLLCRNINGTDLKGDLIYKISGVFESLRFRLNDLSEKVLL
jgi:hypothetical protein